MKKHIYTLIGLLAFAPVFVFAQSLPNVTAFLCSILGILNLVILIVGALAIIYFFWGLVKFIGSAGDAKTRADSQQKMVWGIVALFVMFSIYGIINWLGNAVAITPNLSGTAASSCPSGTTPTDIQNYNPNPYAPTPNQAGA